MSDTHLSGEIPVGEENAVLEQTVKRPTSGNTQDEEDIASSLVIEKIDKNLYRSLTLKKPFKQARGVFGGQIIGQALVAAHRTIDDSDLVCHSLHSYFLLPGDPTTPAVYHVDRIRDGRSFATRSVVVKQNGRAIFSVMVSFHRPERSRLVHFRDMPSVPPPEECTSRREFLEDLVKGAEATGNEARLRVVQRALEVTNSMKSPLEIRYVDPEDSSIYPLTRRKAKEPRTRFWFRCKKRLPDNLWAHHCVASYASDNGLIMAAANAQGYPHVYYSMLASLDHSMWFHSPFRADEWLFYDCESTCAEAGRGLIHGSIYTQAGELAVSVSQEALMRMSEQMRGPPPQKGNAKL